MPTILLLNGPNLNLLGSREPEIYGHETLADIEQKVSEALGKRAELLCYQSNHEGALIDRLQEAHREGVDFVLFNPAGYTHTSVALRDTLLAIQIPFIEIHLSDPSTRESFRHHSYFSDIAVGVIKGQGARGYLQALEQALEHLATNT